MTYRLPPLGSLRAFEAAARHLSFKDAAAELSVTPTAISHQIRGLEEYLHLPLFRRLTRALELTSEGRAMLPKVREGLECFAWAIESTRTQVAGGRLVVTSPPAFAARWLMRHLPDFTAAHPEIRLHMATSLDTIDASDTSHVSGLATVDLRDDETETFIRYGRGQYDGCRVDRLFVPVYTAVCSPRLLLGMRPLNVPADLRRHNLLHNESPIDLYDRPSWGQWLQVAGVTGIDADSGTRISDPGLLLSAAVDGVGVTLASKPLIEAEVAAGRLVVPFDIVIRGPQAYYLVVAEAVADRPVVSVFREWLLGEAAKVQEE
ncbi:MAG TPA: transcriptional regulator GcvA [Accumulibacter sp.]|uniref:transcriptional regulator GcvA n=1 Tax=Accumulibacter sp. TaxID=2053492 RepID=UPI000EE2B444|nr:transcriptional regulator GcvA [Accumulibacter sp.]HCZ15785.1 LysR family transcriptional regulator [Accumulibacter sp.]HRD94339.1 transcriptional regulator GcvA [Accumulibacter sp.]HRF72125.1 transcriptional regulator GcvA [Accumulibacter sp.]